MVYFVRVRGTRSMGGEWFGLDACEGGGASGVVDGSAIEAMSPEAGMTEATAALQSETRDEGRNCTAMTPNITAPTTRNKFADADVTGPQSLLLQYGHVVSRAATGDLQSLQMRCAMADLLLGSLRAVPLRQTCRTFSVSESATMRTA